MDNYSAVFLAGYGDLFGFESETSFAGWSSPNDISQDSEVLWTAMVNNCRMCSSELVKKYLPDF